MRYKNSNEFVNLEKYAPKSCWNVMYMGTYYNGIDLYKHVETRRYINIDDDGKFYLSDGEKYVETDMETAIKYVLS